jgi:hypothetical protein
MYILKDHLNTATVRRATACVGLKPGSSFVEFRALAFGLVFGGNPNPDAEGLRMGFFDF